MAFRLVSIRVCGSRGVGVMTARWGRGVAQGVRAGVRCGLVARAAWAPLGVRAVRRVRTCAVWAHVCECVVGQRRPAEAGPTV